MSDITQIIKELSDLMLSRTIAYQAGEDDEATPNYIQQGALLKALFPTGVTLSTAEDFSRYSLINYAASKLSRYCNNFHSPHEDSIMDLAVYSIILTYLDRVIYRNK